MKHRSSYPSLTPALRAHSLYRVALRAATRAAEKYARLRAPIAVEDGILVALRAAIAASEAPEHATLPPTQQRWALHRAARRAAAALYLERCNRPQPRVTDDLFGGASIGDIGMAQCRIVETKRPKRAARNREQRRVAVLETAHMQLPQAALHCRASTTSLAAWRKENPDVQCAARVRKQYDRDTAQYHGSLLPTEGREYSVVDIALDAGLTCDQVRHAQLSAIAKIRRALLGEHREICEQFLSLLHGDHHALPEIAA